jgi:hypothetical protein
MHVLMWWFTLSLSSLHILSTNFFLFSWQGHISFVCLLYEVVSFFSFQLDSLLLVCTIWIHSNINIAKENYNLQNPNICPRFLPIIITFTKKVLSMFYVTNECDNDFKEWCFVIKWMVAKKCATQTRMWL